MTYCIEVSLDRVEINSKNKPAVYDVVTTVIFCRKAVLQTRRNAIAHARNAQSVAQVRAGVEHQLEMAPIYMAVKHKGYLYGAYARLGSAFDAMLISALLIR